MSRIMLVDDEPNILSALKRSLSYHSQANKSPEHAYVIETFNTPEDALKRIKDCPFDLVISDFRMPSMNGVVLLSKIRDIQPDAIRIILSGHTDLDGLISAINDAQIFRFINKPWIDFDLAQTVDQALQFRHLTMENILLAEVVRIEQGKLTQQEAELRRLERESPGITQVNWGEDGTVIFDDLSEDEIKRLDQYFSRSP